MDKKAASSLLCIMILIPLALAMINVSSASSTPNLYVYDPTTEGKVSSAPIGQTFTIQVIVANVMNLVGFEFYVTWNTSLLRFVSAAEGPFLNSSGAYQSYYGSKYILPKYPLNDTVYVYDTLLSPQLSTSATGTGALATVTFSVIAQGIGKLNLHDSILAKYDPYVPKAIIHTEESGYFALPLPKTVVEPAEIISSAIAPNQNITLNITVFNVANVYNWTLTLEWTPAMLSEASVTEGPLLKNAGATNFRMSVDQAGGFLYMNNTFTGEPSGGVSGNGTLATVNFKVEARGTTDIDIPNIEMFKKDGTFVPSATESGFFSNVVRDVAITSLTLSSSSVEKGQFVNITVVAENHGFVNETFTVRVDYDSHNIGSTPVNNLAPNASTTPMVFRWDTTNVDSGSYTIKATASTVRGEANTADNTRTAGPVTISGGGSGLNLMLIGGAIAAIVLIAIIVFFFYRRSKK